jgi:hypothetical protein
MNNNIPTNNLDRNGCLEMNINTGGTQIKIIRGDNVQGYGDILGNHIR